MSEERDRKRQPFTGLAGWLSTGLWLTLCGGVVVATVGYGDVEALVTPQNCAVARQVVSDMRQRIRVIQETLEDDVVLHGRYPHGWYEPKLLSRTHQPLLRRARKEASHNLARLMARMQEAECNS